MKMIVKNLDPGESSSFKERPDQVFPRIYLHEFELRLGPNEVHDDPHAEVHRRFVQKVEDCEQIMLEKYPELTTDDLEGYILYRLKPTTVKNEKGESIHFGIGSVVVRKAGTTFFEPPIPVINLPLEPSQES
jgi:hypothetical protein